MATQALLNLFWQRATIPPLEHRKRSCAMELPPRSKPIERNHRKNPQQCSAAIDRWTRLSSLPPSETAAAATGQYNHWPKGQTKKVRWGGNERKWEAKEGCPTAPNTGWSGRTKNVDIKLRLLTFCHVRGTFYLRRRRQVTCTVVVHMLHLHHLLILGNPIFKRARISPCSMNNNKALSIALGWFLFQEKHDSDS